MTAPVSVDAPAYDDAPRRYRETRTQKWRNAPPIDAARKAELARRRETTPDVERGIYPFGGLELSRADVEWLLATHDDGQGPVDWHNPADRSRDGLDLRGAILRGVDLGGLPLAKLRALGWREMLNLVHTQREAAIMHLEDANLAYAHLEGANLTYARLEGAKLYGAFLQTASLCYAHLEGSDIAFARLARTDFRKAFFDNATNLYEVVLSEAELGCPSLSDVHWNDVNLAWVEWSAVKMLGDERTALRPRKDSGEPKDKERRLYEFRTAVRAYRQLSVVLRNEGLNEAAARFAYRGQMLDRRVQWMAGKWGAAGFSFVLDLLAGYGYKPARSFGAYLTVLCVFALIYGLLDPGLVWYEPLVMSVASFHGRGFVSSSYAATSPTAIFSTFEAFVGIIIEATFIATLTQRFFGK